MATFTITTNSNYDTLTSPAGDDTYNINGATLTIDTDTRYCANHDATTGNLGATTISANLGGKLLIDGTNVRLIPYDTGSGNVPAIGTTISEGGVSAYLLGVWSAFNAAPTAAGAAMPASGYIKVKNKTGGNFSAGALTGIGASATGADVVGWIEVVGIETRSITASRKDTVEYRGEWFSVGTTNGSANQQIQMPASLANTFYPGVWIETSAGSGSYEFYPAVGSLVSSTTPTDVRGKVVWISSQGLLTIGHDGTNTVGYVPVTGCAIRVPNIITLNATSASKTTNAVPNTTLTTRFRHVFTTAGNLLCDKANIAWDFEFTNPYSYSVTNTGILDKFLVQNCPSSITIDQVGVGCSGSAVYANSEIYFCMNGGTVTDLTLARNGNAIQQPIFYHDCANITTTRLKAIFLLTPTATQAINLQNLTDCTFDYTTAIGGYIYYWACKNVTFTNTSYANQFAGTTGTSNGCPAFNAAYKNQNITIDGLDFMGLTNVHPYAQMIVQNSGDKLTIRNIGTYSSPLSLGSSNATGYVFSFSGGLTNVKVQRVFVTAPRTSPIGYTSGNSEFTHSYENFFCNYANVDVGYRGNGLLVKQGGWINSVLATSACYGTHFTDLHTSTTTGRILIYCNEKLTTEPSNSSYTVSSGTPTFTSAGQATFFTTGDEIIWTTPHYIVGHTGFGATAPTVTGTTATTVDLKYDLDQGSGFSGSYKNLAYYRGGAGGSNGSTNVTMTDTTGVAVNDYVFGTNIGTGAKVQSITNGTTIVVTVANSGTVSGTLTFNQLPNETVTDASVGFKLKVKATATATNTTTVITNIRIDTTSTTTSQQYTFPLGSAKLTLQNVVSGSQYWVALTSDLTQVLANGNGGGSDIVLSGLPLTTDPSDVTIRIRKAGYIDFTTQATLSSNTDATSYIIQAVDPTY